MEQIASSGLGMVGGLNTSPSSAENGKAQSQEKTPKELAVALQTLPSSQGGGINLWRACNDGKNLFDFSGGLLLFGG